MDLYQLKTFFTFGKILNFTDTANYLYITQSAVSHAIKKLEQSVNLKLVERVGSKYQLSDEGRLLFTSCEKIFYEIEKVAEQLKLKIADTVREIWLGSTVEFGTMVLIPEIKGFLEQNPLIRIQFKFSHDLIKSLLQDETDLIIDCKQHINPELEQIVLCQEEYVIVSSPGYLQKKAIATAADLNTSTILSLDKNLKWWDNYFLAFEGPNRPVFRHVIQINHIRGLINATIHGMGVSLLPLYSIYNEIKQGTLVNILPDIRPKHDFISIYVKKERKQLHKIQLLIEYLQSIKILSFQDLH